MQLDNITYQSSINHGSCSQLTCIQIVRGLVVEVLIHYHLCLGIFDPIGRWCFILLTIYMLYASEANSISGGERLHELMVSGLHECFVNLNHSSVLLW